MSNVTVLSSHSFNSGVLRFMDMWNAALLIQLYGFLFFGH
jgi:hypothetical protein